MLGDFIIFLGRVLRETIPGLTENCNFFIINMLEVWNLGSIFYF